MERLLRTPVINSFLPVRKPINLPLENLVQNSRMRCWLLCVLAPLAALIAGPSWAAHGLGMGYAPKYAADYPHFDYVNPDAPKGGSLTLSASGSFDKLNPFI